MPQKCQIIIFYLNTNFSQCSLVEHPEEALPMKEKEDPDLPVWGVCSLSGHIRAGTDIPRPGAGFQEA